MLYRSIAVLLLSSAHVVLGGGYAGCEERVMAFQAYEAERGVPEAQQRLGWKCNTWTKTRGRPATGDTPEVPAVDECTGGWSKCTNASGGRCSYNDFFQWLGKSPGVSNYAVYSSNGRLDGQATAELCHQKHKDKPQRVYNFPGHRWLKDGNRSWPQYINEQRKILQRIAKSGDEEAMNWIRDGDATRRRIITDRAGTHGEFLLARVQSHGFPFAIVPKDVSMSHPNQAGEAPTMMQTVDWRETIKRAVDGGMSRDDVQKRIRDFMKSFYKGNEEEVDNETKQARDHKVVIREYARAENQAVDCRGH